MLAKDCFSISILQIGNLAYFAFFATLLKSFNSTFTTLKRYLSMQPHISFSQTPSAVLPPVTFYPGPSKVYPQLNNYMQDAFIQGILSINHRSSAFMEIYQKAIDCCKRALHIPAQYDILFVSSATESWEVIAQSLIGSQSYHVYNGAFGQKWMEYTQKIHPATSGFFFDVNQQLDIDALQVPAASELIAFTQNETSNGTQVTDGIIGAFKKQYPQKLIAADATSSLGGIALDFNAADVWFASVQKCLGLPAGLGLLIVSPRALDKARQINDRRYYNSLLFMHENASKYQTHYTPNVLTIYLLMRVMESVAPIEQVGKRIEEQASTWYTFFEKMSSLKPLIAHPSVRSQTVIAIEAEKGFISGLKDKARQTGIIIGNGYGAWKETTFRIANFPAIDQQEIKQLQQVIQDFV